MLKRFCNKCKKEIPKKDNFYRFSIVQVGYPTWTQDEVSVEVGTLDYCLDCFDEMIASMGVEK